MKNQPGYPDRPIQVAALYKAICNRDMAAVREKVAEGADPNMLDYEWAGLPVESAVMNADEAMVGLLLELGARPTQVAAFEAVERGMAGKLRLLLRAAKRVPNVSGGGDPWRMPANKMRNRKPGELQRDQSELIDLAIKGRHAGCMRVLHEEGLLTGGKFYPLELMVNVLNEPGKRGNISAEGWLMRSVECRLVLESMFPVLCASREMLENEFINAAHSSDSSATYRLALLAFASRNRSIPVSDTYLHVVADILLLGNAEEHRDWLIMMMQDPVLGERIARSTRGDGRTMLHAMIGRGRSDLARILLDQGADPNAVWVNSHDIRSPMSFEVLIDGLPSRGGEPAAALESRKDELRALIHAARARCALDKIHREMSPSISSNNTGA